MRRRLLGAVPLLSVALASCDSGRPDYDLTAPERIPVRSLTHQPAAGQIVPSAERPAWLGYHGGRHIYVAGPGDPEDFLYRGARRADGTRDGDQSQIIRRLVASGANSLYVQVVRSHGGDGDSTHNPFVDSDPARGLDEALLEQWDGWLSALDAAGVVTYLFLYDDSARIWDTGDEVAAAERAFIRALVARFGHLRHLVWVVAEEYSEAYTAARVSNIARELKQADRRGHPVAVHKLEGLDFSEFADDPYIDQFAAQLSVASPAEAHARMRQAWRQADRRYGNLLAEAPDWGSGAVARQKAWAAALGGAYVLVFEMDVVNTPDGDLADLGRLVAFMNGTDFGTMAPLPQFARAGTRYLLIDPGRAYIAYAPDSPLRLGVNGMAPGRYDLHWFDPISGASHRVRTEWIRSSEHRWNVPEGFGPEVALSVARVPDELEPVFPGERWVAREPAALGLSEPRLTALAEEWGGAGCIARFGYLAFCWGDVIERQEWASAGKAVLSTQLLLAIQEGRLAGPQAKIADLGWPLRGHDRDITYFHLANMISGYAREEPPGQAWAYNDFAINLYGRSLEAVFDAPLDEVFQDRLAALQFEDVPALSSRRGLGLEASIRDATRLGLLWLRGGAWSEAQVLSAALAYRFMTPQVGPGVPLSRGGAPAYLGLGSYGARNTFEVPHGPGLYGYNWWFNEPARPRGPLLWPGVPAGTFQANGHFGREMITMVPSLDMVIATVGPWGGMSRFIPGDPEGPTARMLAQIIAAVGPVAITGNPPAPASDRSAAQSAPGENPVM